MSINFPNLQTIYNQQMDMVLSQTGLTTECQLNFGITQKNICPNCIFDVNLKKSANKYKSGGPINFPLGQLCPYCNGVGYYGEETTKTIYLAIISDSKKWINPPINIAIPDGSIQSICSNIYYDDIIKSKSLTILYYGSKRSNPSYSLYNDPNHIGLGDNNYISAIWKNI